MATVTAMVMAMGEMPQPTNSFQKMLTKSQNINTTTAALLLLNLVNCRRQQQTQFLFGA